MKYCLQHYTAYRYSHSVSQCHNEMRMVPRKSEQQQVISCEVLINPKPETYHERLDCFGNHAAYFNIRHSHQELMTHVTSIVETKDTPLSLPSLNMSWEQALIELAKPSQEHAFLQQFRLPSPMVPYPSQSIQQFANEVFTPSRPVLEALSALSLEIFTQFNYKPGMTTINTPLQEAFDNKQGVCQDFAHIAIACARAIGFPSRYVSGYLETLPPKGQPKLIGADASHAWFSVFVPNVGWMDFDPTNHSRPDSRYVTVAYGRDYADVPPLNGVVFGGGKHSLEVRVDMRPYHEAPVDIIKGIAQRK